MMKNHLIKSSKITENGYEKIETRVKKDVEEAVDYAKESPFPDSSTFTTGLVY